MIKTSEVTERRPLRFERMGDLLDDVERLDAVAGLRKAIGRLDAGERMTKPSPAFGNLSHEQWETLHCRHAELHFSFIQVDA